MLISYYHAQGQACQFWLANCASLKGHEYCTQKVQPPATPNQPLSNPCGPTPICAQYLTLL